MNRVSLRGGPPTKEELLAYYPAKFTWKQLKTFVNSGCVARGTVDRTALFLTFLISDLGLLKRDKALQIRYDDWAIGIRGQYGSMGRWT